ncbi:uncharacterized protein LOC133516490 [Cydia pomonella]|uniref:uncharacterized protein LOC133516490 n=1 Tax=Cydia pomonella TaxID=82600 RepID=UPI002ADD65AA|nr:uncharacterized protein LOC133516490 [Cydia pomonella]
MAKMKNFSLADIPEFSKKERIVVVGIIGKSPYRYPNKTTPLFSSSATEENGIECHWDERHNTLFLHAITYLDTKQLTTLAASLDENSNSTEKDADASHWLVAAGELAAEACKAMALIFHLCHIVVLSSPTPVFDLGYLQLFKAIDAYRTELAPRTSAAVSSLGGAWEAHGRSCCPRLLFHFRRAPRALARNPAGLKRLEHAVEDQLYFILRKARIITNVCAKSLFAIPKNEEFVYMSADEAPCARDVSALVRGLVRRCAGVEPVDNRPERGGLRQFIQGHVDLAFGEGFDDNVGKYAMSTSFFELPAASAWRSAAQALAPLYLESPAAEGGALHDSLATDVRFSHARCAKVLPIAQASYAEGLPAHYSSQHHAHKVSVALGVLHTMARGPVAGAAEARLRAACTAAWRSRSLCEAPSLTAHPCIHPEQSVLHPMARGPVAGAAEARLRAACTAAWRSRSLCEAPSLTAHPCIHPEHRGGRGAPAGRLHGRLALPVPVRGTLAHRAPLHTPRAVSTCASGATPHGPRSRSRGGRGAPAGRLHGRLALPVPVRAVLHPMARGPAAGAAEARLRAACTAAWRSRSLCEAPSLTAHPCIHPEHDNTKEHSSGVRYISACNCGRSKCSRDDPYTVKAANCTFYTTAAAECGVCNTLTSVAFPVFTPSTPTYRAASVKAGSQEAEPEPRASDGNSGCSGWSAGDALSPGSGDEDPGPQYLVPVRDNGEGVTRGLLGLVGGRRAVPWLRRRGPRAAVPRARPGQRTSCPSGTTVRVSHEGCSGWSAGDALSPGSGDEDPGPQYLVPVRDNGEGVTRGLLGLVGGRRAVPWLRRRGPRAAVPCARPGQRTLCPSGTTVRVSHEGCSGWSAGDALSPGSGDEDPGPQYLVPVRDNGEGVTRGLLGLVGGRRAVPWLRRRGPRAAVPCARPRQRTLCPSGTTVRVSHEGCSGWSAGNALSPGSGDEDPGPQYLVPVRDNAVRVSHEGCSGWSAGDALSPGSGDEDPGPQYLVPVRDNGEGVTRGLLGLVGGRRAVPWLRRRGARAARAGRRATRCPLAPGTRCPARSPSCPSGTTVRVSHEGCSGWSAGDALSPGSGDEEPGPQYLVPVRDNEKVITRQPSTTEYLPGMLHTASPPGLLPAFSSWSLVCLGASSLYSHSLGLPEHLQPGLLPHTNYLLPWDARVRSVNIQSLYCLLPLVSSEPLRCTRTAWACPSTCSRGCCRTPTTCCRGTPECGQSTYSPCTASCPWSPRSLFAVLAQLGPARAPAAGAAAAHQLPAAVGRQSAVSQHTVLVLPPAPGLLGASSLYSHSLGLPEHLQPGLLPHTNYLLPWDARVRMEQVSAWRAAQASARGRGKGTAPHHLTVKIFLGFEYECPRGHRFMMSSPDTVVSGGGGACGRDAGAAGARLAASDMPLHAPCLCRGSSAMLAQLMRVHVVTPKAPVHVTLDPKVQPVTGGPIFVPEPAGSEPIELSGSAYWVLRLPYIYADERGPLPRPRQASGLLLAPLLGLRE